MPSINQLDWSEAADDLVVPEDGDFLVVAVGAGFFAILLDCFVCDDNAFGKQRAKVANQLLIVPSVSTASARPRSVGSAAMAVSEIPICFSIRSVVPPMAATRWPGNSLCRLK